MDPHSRRDFLKQVGLISAGICSIGTLSFIEACSTTSKVGITETSNQLSVPKTSVDASGYASVKSNRFEQPIFITKKPDGTYEAVLLLCTHKGCALNPSNGQLVCPCHGSIFTPDGAVVKGPATQPLKTFPVTSDDKNVMLKFQ
jgi:cytochrome b6-f complex iron-sulfur subunit